MSLTRTNGQRIIYKIEWKDDSIGYMVAEKKKVGSVTEYSLESRSQFRMLLKFDLHSFYSAQYDGGVMTQSLAKNLLNDKTRSQTTVTYDKGTYTVENDDGTTKISSEINESIAAMYFNEPGSGEIFSERYGQFCKVKKLGDHKYALFKPDENSNEYTFKNGICEQAIVNLDLATIYIKRIN